MFQVRFGWGGEIKTICGNPRPVSDTQLAIFKRVAEKCYPNYDTFVGEGDAYSSFERAGKQFAFKAHNRSCIYVRGERNHRNQIQFELFSETWIAKIEFLIGSWEVTQHSCFIGNAEDFENDAVLLMLGS